MLGPYILPYDSLYIDACALRWSVHWGIITSEPTLSADIAARLFMAGRIFAARRLFRNAPVHSGRDHRWRDRGYRGGWIGAALMRTVDGFLAFPSISSACACRALKPSAIMITVVMPPAAGWKWRASRGRGSLAPRTGIRSGGRMLRIEAKHIMFREILPNAVGPIIVASTLTIARPS